MNANCPVLRRRFFSEARKAAIPNRWRSIVGALGLLLPLIVQGQTWMDVPGWPGLRGSLIPQDFPSPQLSFSASPETLTFWWPGYASNFVMETSMDLASGVWTREPDSNRLTVGDTTITTMPFDSDQKYFRLRAPLTFWVPIFEFAIFYNSLLEFTWQAAFAVNGPVYADGNIFVGSSASLRFNSTVFATGGIYKTNWDGHTVSQMTGPIIYNGTPPYFTNAGRVEVPFGANNTPEAIREMLNLPSPGEDPLSPMGLRRYYNLAQVALLVTDTNVSVYLKNSGTDAPTVITVTNYAFYAINNIDMRSQFPFLSVTNAFIDQRELSKTVRPTQIDVALYKNWLVTNSSVIAKFPVSPSWPIKPYILYVADLRTIGGNTNLYSVRLANGAIIPTNGFPSTGGGWTVVTPNPLYVSGHYNIGPGGSTVAGNADTSHTYPAALISDALTILSLNWSDANSGGSLGSRRAVNTTINAAILTGTIYSTDGSSNYFSGGVMNVPRLLEDWTGDTLTLNTSIVNLFASARATNRFANPGIYYYAPTRLFSLDQNFTNYAKLPPGTPFVRLYVAPE